MQVELLKVEYMVPQALFSATVTCDRAEKCTVRSLQNSLTMPASVSASRPIRGPLVNGELAHQGFL